MQVTLRLLLVLPLALLVGIASDGAAVMRGCRSAVMARVTEGLPHVIAWLTCLR